MKATHLVERAMRKEWPSPYDLCSYLELAPTEKQAALFDQYLEGKLDFRNEEESIRGLCICLLWSALSNPGTMTYVIGEELPVAWVIGFLQTLLERSETLSEIANVSQGKITFGTDPGWGIRGATQVVSPDQGTSALHGVRDGTAVLLDAGKDWACVAEEILRRIPDMRLVRTF